MRTSSPAALGSLNQTRPLPSETGIVERATAAPAPTVEQAREDVRVATAELIASIRSLKTETRPVINTSVVAVGTAGRTLDLSDTSRLLAALGIASGTAHGVRGRTQVVVTETGTETVTNAGAVATNANSAIGKLNAALAMLESIRASAPEATRQIEAAIRNAIYLLGTAGIDGLSLDQTSNGLRIKVNETALANSLAANAATQTSTQRMSLDVTSDSSRTPAPSSPRRSPSQ